MIAERQLAIAWAKFKNRADGNFDLVSDVGWGWVDGNGFDTIVRLVLL